MTQFFIRRTVPGDSKALAELETECFSRPWSEDSLIKATEREDNIYFSAVCGDRVVGYIGSYRVLGEVYINNIAVFKDYRNKGIGKALIKALSDYCKENSCEFCTLEVRKSNTNAISLYEKCGFVLVGERKNFYDSPTENALLYTLFFGD